MQPRAGRVSHPQSSREESCISWLPANCSLYWKEAPALGDLLYHVNVDHHAFLSRGKAVFLCPACGWFADLYVQGKLQSSQWAPMVTRLSSVFPSVLTLDAAEPHALHPTASAPQRTAIRSFSETMATKRINFCLVSVAQSCYLSTVQKIARAHITTIS